MQLQPGTVRGAVSSLSNWDKCRRGLLGIEPGDFTKTPMFSQWRKTFLSSLDKSIKCALYSSTLIVFPWDEHTAMARQSPTRWFLLMSVACVKEQVRLGRANTTEVLVNVLR